MSKSFPLVPLRKIVRPAERLESVIAGKAYRQIGVRLWGEGAYERETIDGSQTKYSVLSRVETNDIVINKIWARNGSVAVVSKDLGGCYGSGEFPTFIPDRSQLEPRWFHWLTKTHDFWNQCDEKSQGTSGKNRIRPEQFLQVLIPLPSLDEQQRIVVRIEKLAAKIEEARGLYTSINSDIYGTLLSAYNTIIKNAQYLPMRDVAPLERRPIEVKPEEEYFELGIRSFGKGTFHKPSITGAALGTKRIFSIEEGDLLFNIVFAWEGAVAVAQPEDRGRVGSHRFLTCVPQKDVATSFFLRFHFLTDEGLQQLLDASPGSAGRNRTLGIKALEGLQVPVPPLEKQLWFDSLQERFNLARHFRSEALVELDAVLPSVLDKAFKGEL